MVKEEDPMMQEAEERRSLRRSASTTEEAEETRKKSVSAADAHGTSPAMASAFAACGNANGLPEGNGRSSNSSPLFSADEKSGNSSFSATCSSSQGSLPSMGRKDDVSRVASWAQYLSMAGQVKQEENELDMSQLFLGQKFACGAYSRLYRGQYMDEEVAVKIMLQPEDDEVVASKLDRQFGQEVALLSRLQHPNVVEFVGAMRKPPVFTIITKYVSGGSLRAYLHKHQPHALPMNMVLSFAFDVARGMEYLHSLGVLHLDLKSNNLVLGDNLSLKVTDFGVARHETECASMTPDAGTYRWMAPEMISNKAFSTKADVYSFGIILWEILTGQIPYEEMSIIQAAFAVAHKKARPIIPDRCPRALKQLMEECWHENPGKRPSFTEIVLRLEDFQQCFMRNESMQASRCKCEKSSWLASVLQKLKPVCAAGK